jgi:hypothetical protein
MCSPLIKAERYVIGVIFAAFFGMLLNPCLATPSPSQNGTPSLDEKLNSQVGEITLQGRPVLDSLLDIIYQFQLPTAIEYLDEGFVLRPVHDKLKGSTVREVMNALIGQAPGYRIDFTGGVIQIYSVLARSDPKNLLNISIDKFNVRQLDVQTAGAELFSSVSQKAFHVGSVNSIAGGGFHSKKITLEMQDARVYEILSQIVSRSGEAIWCVQHKPNELNNLNNLWHIFTLEMPTKAIILERSRALFDTSKR